MMRNGLDQKNTMATGTSEFSPPWLNEYLNHGKFGFRPGHGLTFLTST